MKKQLKIYLKEIGQKKVSNTVTFFSLVFLSTLVLLWVAIWNKYPLVFNDTAFYITKPKADRTAGYNLFIFITSFFNISLWPVVFFQAFITNLLLIRISCLTINHKSKEWIAFIILLLMAVFTDISRYVSWLIPDVFTSWLFLGGFLFFISAKWYDRLLAAIAILSSIFCHTSHIPIAILCLITMVGQGFLYRKKYPYIWDTSKKLTACILWSLVLLSFYNLSIGWGFSIFPPEKGNYLMARLAHYGIVSKTLDKYGQEKQWHIYKIKNELNSAKGKSTNWILWIGSSPYRKLNVFKNHQKEVQEIIFCALWSHFFEIMHFSLKDTFSLLISVNSHHSEREIDYAVKFIREKYPTEFNSFAKSNQFLKRSVRVKIIPFNDKATQIVIFSYAVILIAVLLLRKESLLRLYIYSALLFIFYNAFITASISGVSDRYNTRILWLLPYILFLASFIFINKLLKRN